MYPARHTLLWLNHHNKAKEFKRNITGNTIKVNITFYFSRLLDIRHSESYRNWINQSYKIQYIKKTQLPRTLYVYVFKIWWVHVCFHHGVLSSTSVSTRHAPAHVYPFIYVYVIQQLFIFVKQVRAFRITVSFTSNIYVVFSFYQVFIQTSVIRRVLYCHRFWTIYLKNEIFCKSIYDK